MKYIVIPDKSNPTHQSKSDGARVRIVPIIDGKIVDTIYPIISSLDDYRIIPNPILTQAKADKGIEINAKYSASIADGVTFNSIKYSLLDQDRLVMSECLAVLCPKLFTENSTKLYESLISSVFNRKICDYNGKLHDMKVKDFIQVAYKIVSTIGELQSGRDERLHMLKNAYTIEDIKNI